jgi:hypothetical protein
MVRQRAARMREELEPGTRVCLSALAKMRCPKMTRDAGVVVAKVPHSDALRILMDGNKDSEHVAPELCRRRANLESTRPAVAPRRSDPQGIDNLRSELGSILMPGCKIASASFSTRPYRSAKATRCGFLTP